MSSVIPDPALNDWVPMWNLGNNIPAAQPSARVYRSTAQSIPTGTWTAVVHDTVRYDTGGQWSAGNPSRLTAQVAGTYVITGGLLFTASTAGVQRSSGIRLNGANWLSIGPPLAQTFAAGSGAVSVVATVVQLNAGDYVELMAMQDSGGALNLSAGDAATVRYVNDLSMALVGGMQGPPGPSLATYGTSFPASPLDGQRHILVDSATTPTYQWEFRYNASSTSAYKWEFVGGAPIYSYMSDAPSIASGWAIVTTPQVTPPRPGVYLIQAHCRYLQIPTAGYQLHIAGGSSADASGIESAFLSPSIANQVTPMQPPLVQRTLLAGQTAVMWVYNGCPTAGTIGGRSLTVTPVRVS